MMFPLDIVVLIWILSYLFFSEICWLENFTKKVFLKTHPVSIFFNSLQCNIKYESTKLNNNIIQLRCLCAHNSESSFICYKVISYYYYKLTNSTAAYWWSVRSSYFIVFVTITLNINMILNFPSNKVSQICNSQRAECEWHCHQTQKHFSATFQAYI